MSLHKGVQKLFPMPEIKVEVSFDYFDIVRVLDFVSSVNPNSAKCAVETCLAEFEEDLHLRFGRKRKMGLPTGSDYFLVCGSHRKAISEYSNGYVVYLDVIKEHYVIRSIP